MHVFAQLTKHNIIISYMLSINNLGCFLKLIPYSPSIMKAINNLIWPTQRLYSPAVIIKSNQSPHRPFNGPFFLHSPQVETQFPAAAIPQLILSLMENSNPNTISRVQHVAKSSSDELLRKFAEVSSDSNDRLRLAKRPRKRSQVRNKESVTVCRHHCAEGKSLLPCAAAANKPIRRMGMGMGMGKAKMRLPRYLNNTSIIAAIEKTWRRTVEGASRVLMEKHYNRHKRLINDS